MSDASVSIRDKVGSETYTLPKQISDLDLKGGYEYAPVHYTVDDRSFELPRHVAGTLDG